MLQQSNDKACTFYKCNNRTYYSAIVPLKTEEEDLRQGKGEIVSISNIISNNSALVALLLLIILIGDVLT